jgi:hypothetical protein
MKDVAGLEDTYTITPDGVITSKPRPRGNGSVLKSRVMKPFNNGRGYFQISLTDSNGVRKKYYIHRLVWLTYRGDIPEGFEIDHINCIKTDNSIHNLQLLTRKDNMKKCLKDNPHIINNLKYQGNT